ncbi:hypothetical protein amb1686 [Paramagnetospirillum magneticum AMB-1]|uniref:Uncharacterized protein n=1 Tax=Paramagnetospirillum magneticum (strain ATCC 700264 / AMB-1) TaxID=342108 RepID=Q2W6N5_PARM1|nr:hypothetical protein amb0903 [Paramagnetospirillum magneticum AMB-1]BAE50490.1 hypothetical protein amb1686 [Paramagnetospirillum magneticum AMB-1]
MGERVLCKHEVVGSIPSGSTKLVSSPQDFHSRLSQEIRPELRFTGLVGPPGAPPALCHRE